MASAARSVVVTGIGAVTPLGVGTDALIDGWLAERSAVVDGLAHCWDFEPGEHFDRKELRRIDPFSQFALAAAHEAVEGAGGQSELGDPSRVACIIGTSVGGVTTMTEAAAQLAARPVVGRLANRDVRGVSPTMIIKSMPNAAAGAVALRYGFQGPCTATNSACAAGADAIAMGVRLIRAGEADVVLAGGAEAAITDELLSCFFVMDACSVAGVSRPFDAERDGFVPGEGAAMLVLESEEHAARRGAPVRGRVLGYGSTADAFHMAAPRPEGEGAAAAMTRAIEDAGVAPEDVSYINAHGSSTPLNDRAETLAIKSTFNGHSHKLAVSSTKSAIGHPLGASGAIEAVATLLAFDRDTLPPTLNYKSPDPGLDLDYLPRPRPLRSDEQRVALSNSFGFGGHNTVLCLAGAPTTEDRA